MRWRLTLLLVLLNLILLGAIVVFSRFDSAERAREEGRLLFSAGFLESVRAIRLTGEEGTVSWALVRNDRGDWELQEPFAWPANPYAVENLLQQLRFLRWDSRFAVDELDATRSLLDYGLLPPQAVLSLDDGEAVTALPIGVPTEVGRRLYLLSPDQEEVLVVEREAVAAALVPAETLLSRDVLDLEPYSVRALTIERPAAGNLRVRLVREAETWNLVAPVEATADATAVQQALIGLTGLEVRRFLGPTEPPLEQPELRIVLEDGLRRQELLVGRIPPSGEGDVLVRLADHPVTVAVAAAPLQVFTAAQEALRRKEILSFDPTLVNALTVAMSDSQIRLQRLENGQWQILENGSDGLPQPQQADTPLINDLLTDLQRTRALQFVSDAPSEADLERFGLTGPQRRVLLETTGGDSVTLLLGAWREPGQSLYAKVDGEPTIYLVPQDLLWSLPLNTLHYRAKSVRDLPEGAVILGISIETQEGVALVEQAPPEGGLWEDSLQGLPEANATAWRTLRDYLRQVQAEQYLADAFAAPFPLDAETEVAWAYRLRVRLRLPGGESDTSREEILLLSRRLGGTTQLAAYPETGPVFTLPARVILALSVLLPGEPGPAVELPAPSPADAPAE